MNRMTLLIALLLAIFITGTAFAEGEMCSYDSECMIGEICFHGFCERVYPIAPAGLITPAMTCKCHALDRSNPSKEAACNALQVGTTCGRVGDLICIPECK